MDKRWLRIVLVGAVVILFVSLRAYQLDTLSTFGRDQGMDFLAVNRMIEDERISLLGIKTSIGEFHQGPVYRWMLVPLMWLSGGRAIAGAWTAVAVSGLSLLAMLAAVNKWWGAKTALLAGVLYAVSPEMIIMGASPLYQNFIPLFFFLSLGGWLWAQDKSNNRWLLLLTGIAAGLTFEMHYLAISWVAVLAGLILYYIKDKIRALFLYLLGLVVGTAPSWLFEIRHEFLNTRLLLEYLTTGGDKPISIGEKLVTWINGSAIYLAGLDQKLGALLLAAVLWLVISAVRRQGKIDRLNIVVVFVGLGMIGLTLVFSLTEPHYLLPLWLLAFVLLAQAVVKSRSGLWQGVFVVLIGINLLAVLPRYYQNHGYYMPAGWSISSVVKTSEIVAGDLSTDNTANFNVASLLSGDTRTYPLRFVLTRLGYPPRPVESYPQIERLYLVARPGTELGKVNVWEIYSVRPFITTNSWPVNKVTTVYRLDRGGK